MNASKPVLASLIVAAAALLPLQSASAWWGPWGPVGAWGAPVVVLPPGVERIPGWSPEETAARYGFDGPYGPSITQIRRLHRDLAWGRPFDDLYNSPLGPSPTELRRQERRAFLRELQAGY